MKKKKLKVKNYVSRKKFISVNQIIRKSAIMLRFELISLKLELGFEPGRICFFFWFYP